MIAVITGWMFALGDWFLTLLPELAFGPIDQAEITTRLVHLAPIFPMEGLSLAMFQWTSLMGAAILTLGIRFVLKIVVAIRGGGW